MSGIKILGLILQIITGIGMFVSTISLMFAFSLQSIEVVKWLLPLTIYIYLSFFSLYLMFSTNPRKYSYFIGLIVILTGIIGVGGIISTILNIYSTANLQLGGIGLAFSLYSVLCMLVAFSDEVDWQ